ncbi:MAG TPA: hypothetical protein VMX58_03860 [Patescibacteria group bacterium]|nr:hypothetical protein [Patescibacteria group bacterium]
MTMRKFGPYLLSIGILAALTLPAFAEPRTISWGPVTTYTDGTPIEAGKTVTYSSYWTTDPGLGSLRTIATSLATTSATFDPGVQGMTRGGTVYFTMKTRLNTGEESALSPAYAWVVPAGTPPAVVLSSIAVSGPSSVNEGGTGTYTATAAWSDGTNTSVTPAWSVSPATYASISQGGVLTTLAVTANQTATVTASYTSGGVTRTATRSVTIVNVSATLSSIAVSGPSSVNEGGTGTYTATAAWSDGTNTSVTPAWSVSPATYASISQGGVLTTLAVTANQTATVTASYSSGGVTRTATRSVTIVNVSATTPAAAKNIGITGPISSGTTMLWRLAWDPVTTYENGAPIESGRTVRYTAYWTDDPALSPASLRILASSIPATMVEFDPLANPMVENQVIYLTVQSILDTGDPSSLAASITWVVANTGPAPPAGGMIIKK